MRCRARRWSTDHEQGNGLILLRRLKSNRVQLFISQNKKNPSISLYFGSKLLRAIIRVLSSSPQGTPIRREASLRFTSAVYRNHIKKNTFYKLRMLNSESLVTISFRMTTGRLMVTHPKSLKVRRKARGEYKRLSVSQFSKGVRSESNQE